MVLDQSPDVLADFLLSGAVDRLTDLGGVFKLNGHDHSSRGSELFVRMELASDPGSPPMQQYLGIGTAR